MNGGSKAGRWNAMAMVVRATGWKAAFGIFHICFGGDLYSCVQSLFFVLRPTNGDQRRSFIKGPRHPAVSAPIWKVAFPKKSWRISAAN